MGLSILYYEGEIIRQSTTEHINEHKKKVQLWKKLYGRKFDKATVVFEQNKKVKSKY